jgi:plastocyanin
MKTTLPLSLAAIGLAVSVPVPVASAVAGPPVARTAATRVVKLQNIRINPSRLVIHAGDRVTWQFLDAPIMSEHTVTPRGGGPRFKGTGAHMSGSYSVTFVKPGTYLYECTIHPGMQGRIIVR